MRPVWQACALATLIATAGCGGGEPSAPAPGGGGDAGTITGNERIGWDQQASSTAELAAFHYALYVDGNRTELANPSCGNTPVDSAYSCSARLPGLSSGTHTLELATFIVSGEIVESPRSAPITVRVVAATASNSISAAKKTSARKELTTADGARLRVDSIADALESPTALAFAHDGRTFVTERAGRVRIMGDLAASEPALTLDDVLLINDAGGLLGLTLDPEFERTGFVYLLDVVADRSGAPTFRLTRYREAGGRLGERALILQDVAASPSRPAGSIAFGPDKKLYVALDDGDDPERAARMSSFNGKVLRLNSDGTTPDDQPAATPVFSGEHRSPRSLGWDATTGAMWLADPIRRDVERVVANASDRARVERPIQTAFELPFASGPTAVLQYRGALIEAFRGDLLAGSSQEGTLLRVRFDGETSASVASTERLQIDGVEHVSLIAAAPDGALYVGTDRELLRLAPR